MSSQVTTAFVKQFSANVYMLAQQKGSRLASAVRNESQKSDQQFFDRIGVANAVEKTSRHMDTPQVDTPHSRRSVALQDWIYADLIDSADLERMLLDPTSPYVQAAVNALGRKKDDIIIAAASGTAYTGVAGATSTSLGNGQKLASVASSAGANLNVQALRRAKRILDAADVDPSIPRYCALNASALENLLSQTEVSSSDYNTVKALVQGEVDTFMGFKFILSNRLATQASALSFNQTTGAVNTGSGAAAGYYKVLCWAEDGLILSTGMEVKARVDERADKNYSTQIYAEMGVGAVRMEEAKVVEVLCAQ